MQKEEREEGTIKKEKTKQKVNNREQIKLTERKDTKRTQGRVLGSWVLFVSYR